MDFMNADSSTSGQIFTTFLVGIILLCVYFLPSWIAEKRKTANRNGVFILNLLTGWTGLGWLMCLFIACGSNSPTEASNTDQATDAVEALERLSEMKEKGILSDSEFKAQKKKILRA